MYAIKVENMTKQFKIHSDKPMTLKERLVSLRNNKVIKRTVLENINLEIKMHVFLLNVPYQKNQI